MKKIILFLLLLPLFSCNSEPTANVADNDVDDCVGCGDENIKYIKKANCRCRFFSKNPPY